MRMNKKEKTALVPRLRFPEFRSMGEWKISMLSNLASKITVRNQDDLISRVLTNSAVEGVVDQSDYFNREVANPNNLENYFVLDEGDYVYNPRISVNAPVGPISKNKVGRGVMSPLYTVFRFEKPNNDFYEQYFKTNLWHSYLKSVSNTGARHDRMSISNGNFMKMPLPYPSEGEQEKIANCLFSLDDLIAAEDKKLEALKAHKKGLMQKLFPAEGKTVPEWRFPEFKDSGEWETSILDFLAVKITEKNNDKNLDRVLTNSAVNGVVDQQDFFDKDIANRSNLANYYVLDEGDYVYNPRISVTAPVGPISRNNVGKGVISPLYTVFRFKNKSNDYFEHFFKTTCWHRYLKSISNTGARHDRMSISSNAFMNMPLTYPASKKEQQKIADCLSNLDYFINAQSEKIEALQAHKKSLMQGLFPSLEEVGE
jgi:type I restriction enzyme S subunit